jgi:hypothetical protein
MISEAHPLGVGAEHLCLSLDRARVALLFRTHAKVEGNPLRFARFAGAVAVRIGFSHGIWSLFPISLTYIVSEFSAYLSGKVVFFACVSPAPLVHATMLLSGESAHGMCCTML